MVVRSNMPEGKVKVRSELSNQDKTTWHVARRRRNLCNRVRRNLLHIFGGVVSSTTVRPQQQQRSGASSPTANHYRQSNRQRHLRVSKEPLQLPRPERIVGTALAEQQWNLCNRVGKKSGGRSPSDLQSQEQSSPKLKNRRGAQPHPTTASNNRVQSRSMSAHTTLRPMFYNGLGHSTEFLGVCPILNLLSCLCPEVVGPLQTPVSLLGTSIAMHPHLQHHVRPR